MKASTLGTKVENTAGAKTGDGIAKTEFSITPSEQHEAQALHFCVVAWLSEADAAASAGTSASIVAGSMAAGAEASG